MQIYLPVMPSSSPQAQSPNASAAMSSTQMILAVNFFMFNSVTYCFFFFTITLPCLSVNLPQHIFMKSTSEPMPKRPKVRL